MPEFLTLFIKEHVSNNPEILDTKLAVLYDPDEYKYYVYGTRNNGKDGYLPFSYIYDNTESLLLFIRYSMNMFDKTTFITVELHNVDILEDTYHELNYNNIYSKTSRQTEISAYDEMRMTKRVVSELLQLIVCV